MAAKPLPSQALVRQLLNYDAGTGIFTWRWRPRTMFKNDRLWRSWNMHYAYSCAGHSRDKAKYNHIRIKLNRINYLAHRLAWLYVYGNPVPELIDHIDNDFVNNKINNLRIATKSQNRINASLNKNNSLGIKGIYRRAGDRYVAQLTAHGTTMWLGTFDTLEEATEARRQAAERWHGTFARHA